MRRLSVSSFTGELRSYMLPHSPPFLDALRESVRWNRGHVSFRVCVRGACRVCLPPGACGGAWGRPARRVECVLWCRVVWAKGVGHVRGCYTCVFVSVPERGACCPPSRACCVCHMRSNMCHVDSSGMISRLASKPWVSACVSWSAHSLFSLYTCRS